MQVLEDYGAVDLRLLVLQQQRHVEDREAQHVAHTVRLGVVGELLAVDEHHELAIRIPARKVAQHAHLGLTDEFRRIEPTKVTRVLCGKVGESLDALERLRRIPLALAQRRERLSARPSLVCD